MECATSTVSRKRPCWTPSAILACEEGSRQPQAKKLPSLVRNLLNVTMKDSAVLHDIAEAMASKKPF